MRAFITRFKRDSSNHEFKVYVIQSSTLKRFLVMEIIVGTLAYHAAFYLCHNAILAGAGSWAGTESLKRLPLVVKRIVSF
ncbi:MULTISPECIES: hypothetical protein [Paenibacillus]|uniref:Uncharacterized protein n=1 Tax=Paenibacillus xylanilyticus TaxID=248903 RepID=A0A7Y6BXX1_9BACL|nr:hypothetical protein [Paenibacillus xylanilyticus]NUU76638.1 hypothetical protein [Paenibacillus xylanilyticus]